MCMFVVKCAFIDKHFNYVIHRFHLLTLFMHFEVLFFFAINQAYSALRILALAYIVIWPYRTIYSKNLRTLHENTLTILHKWRTMQYISEFIIKGVRILADRFNFSDEIRNI